MAITLDQILEALGRPSARIDLFGVPSEFEEVYESRLTGLYEAMYKELAYRQLSVSNLRSLPDSTEFHGPEVERLFNKLCQWLDSHRQEIIPDVIDTSK
ncbi:hypothetical protein A3C67_03115 [Candidatus Nomurabacteria bacterium RIFCSPHIGHO2_02_FULL_42_19]|uniref:Uncharacterized protein n=1 Tax=Candidatus Nomurabacteria bacterium RIFCSPHIGHO2_02_FULL_42_19 TaxID=1801756 RepID=A0A1F6W2X1_9BACT|nr:MAG: hypothetical protein A3C67_03115 [Candidatus Nomurabacteria bacterium RIFCSPHIGHO2_02_FULL_42_19]